MQEAGEKAEAVRDQPASVPEPRSKTKKANSKKRRPPSPSDHDPSGKQDPGERVGGGEVAIENIRVGRNVRHQEQGIKEIAASFEAEGGETRGQLQEIGVMREAGSTDRYLLLWGHQRLAAAKSLNWKTIRVGFWELGKRDPIFKQLAENQRRSSMGPIEEAEAFSYLIKVRGMTAAEIAREYGCHPSHISHRLKLLKDLAPSVQRRVGNGDRQLSGSKALALTQLPPDEQDKVANSAISGEWSLGKLEREIKAIKSQRTTLADRTTQKPTELVIPETVEVEHAVLPEDLSATDYLRLAVWIILRQGNDQAVLEYLDDRHIPWDDLYEYVRDQNAKELTATMKTLVRRYVEAPHRYSSIEENLKTSLGVSSSRGSYERTTGEDAELPIKPRIGTMDLPAGYKEAGDDH